jgi:OOP family OmpA-OmpF porin
MHLNKLVIAAVMGFAGAAAMPSLAMAQTPDRGWYIGGTIGKTDVDLECGGGITCDDSDTAWRILGGYQLNRNFAVEAGYHDFGKASQSIPGLSADFKAKAWEIVGVGAVPIGSQFALYGKAGFYRGEVDVRTGGQSTEETNTDLTFGFGAQYNFNRQLGLRAEWQRYADMGDNSTIGESDVDVLSVGIVYRFR